MTRSAIVNGAGLLASAMLLTQVLVLHRPVVGLIVLQGVMCGAAVAAMLVRTPRSNSK